MAHYMIGASYSKEGISNLVKNPQDRSEAVRSLIESVGGRMEAFYFALGEDDVVVIAEVPDNVTMAALSMAVSASGSLSSFKTPPTPDGGRRGTGHAQGGHSRLPATRKLATSTPITPLSAPTQPPSKEFQR